MRFATLLVFVFFTLPLILAVAALALAYDIGMSLAEDYKAWLFRRD